MLITVFKRKERRKNLLGFCMDMTRS